MFLDPLHPCRNPAYPLRQPIISSLFPWSYFLFSPAIRFHHEGRRTFHSIHASNYCPYLPSASFWSLLLPLTLCSMKTIATLSPTNATTTGKLPEATVVRDQQQPISLLYRQSLPTLFKHSRSSDSTPDTLFSHCPLYSHLDAALRSDSFQHTYTHCPLLSAVLKERTGSVEVSFSWNRDDRH